MWGFSDEEAGGGVIPILAHGSVAGIYVFYAMGVLVIALIIGIGVAEIRRWKRRD